MYITLFYHKSMRKNAKAEMSNIVNDRTNRSDVLKTIVNQLDTLFGVLEKFGTKKIIAKAYISKDFTGLEKEVVNGKHTFNNMYMLKTGRQQFYSIEDFINFLYTVIGFSDSVYTLSLDDLYNDDSIRYFIQKYYTNKKED